MIIYLIIRSYTGSIFSVMHVIYRIQYASCKFLQFFGFYVCNKSLCNTYVIPHTLQWLTGSHGYTIFQNPGRPLFLAGRLEWRWFLVYVEDVQLFGFRFSPDLFIRCLITVSLHRTVWFHTSKRSSSHWNVSPLCMVNLTRFLPRRKIH